MGLWLGLVTLLLWSEAAKAQGTLTIPLEYRGTRVSVRELQQKIAKIGSQADLLEEESLALLQNVKSLQYIGTLYFGSDYQESKCIFDNGSSNTWTYTNKCTTVACMNHNRIDISSRQSNTEITIEYGSGDIRGYLFNDPISFEKCESTCELSPNCHCTPHGDWIGVISTKGSAFDYGEFNCILGLAHPKLAADGTKMSLVSMMEYNRLTTKKFGFFLTKTADLSGSRFTIGEVDPSLYKGDLNYHSLYHPKESKPSYWSVKLMRVTLKYPDGRVIDTGFCLDGCEMALDSGTSLFTGPERMIYPLIDQLDVEEDCSNQDSLPMIGFTVDSPLMTYWISPQSYVYKEDANVCIGSFFPLNVPRHETLWIAGDSFLSSYYSVYDFSCWDGSGECKAGLAAKSSQVLNGLQATNLGTVFSDTDYTSITPGDVTELQRKSDFDTTPLSLENDKNEHSSISFSTPVSISSAAPVTAEDEKIMKKSAITATQIQSEGSNTQSTTPASTVSELSKEESLEKNQPASTKSAVQSQADAIQNVAPEAEVAQNVVPATQNAASQVVTQNVASQQIGDSQPLKSASEAVDGTMSSVSSPAVSQPQPVQTPSKDVSVKDTLTEVKVVEESKEPAQSKIEPSAPGHKQESANDTQFGLPQQKSSIQMEFPSSEGVTSSQAKPAQDNTPVADLKIEERAVEHSLTLSNEALKEKIQAEMSTASSKAPSPAKTTGLVFKFGLGTEQLDYPSPKATKEKKTKSHATQGMLLDVGADVLLI